MKNVCRLVIIWAIVLSMAISACTTGGKNGSSDPGAAKTCQEGVCAQIDVVQPIVLNQPANIVITISSTVDKPGLSIILQASPTNVTFGPNTLWQYDAIANQSKTFTSTITFTSSGGYLVGAEVFWKGSPLVVNQDRVVIDVSGATVNPTIPPRPTSNGYPVATPLSPKDLTATAQAQAEITLTPPPPVQGFTPQQWLEKCGWTVKQPKTLTEWPGISGWLNITETSVIGEKLDGTLSVGFKDEANPDVTIQARIGLCSVGQGWTTDGNHEWNATLRSGTPFEVPVSVNFTQAGDIPNSSITVFRDTGDHLPALENGAPRVRDP